jgi:monothiol glutaredoxin
MTDIKSWIDNTVHSNDVVLFMKGNAEMPMCGFSGRSTQILKAVGVDFKDINVLENDELRQGIKDYTNWPTIPQLYVKGEFVGGADILMEMYQSGELKQMLADKGVSMAAA